MKLVISPIAKPIANGFRASVGVLKFNVFIIWFLNYYFLIDVSKVGTHQLKILKKMMNG